MFILDGIQHYLKLSKFYLFKFVTISTKFYQYWSYRLPAMHKIRVFTYALDFGVAILIQLHKASAVYN